jgi:hypothetical protein
MLGMLNHKDSNGATYVRERVCKNIVRELQGDGTFEIIFIYGRIIFKWILRT